MDVWGVGSCTQAFKLSDSCYFATLYFVTLFKRITKLECSSKLPVSLPRHTQFKMLIRQMIHPA